MARSGKRRERSELKTAEKPSDIRIYKTAIYVRLSREDNLSGSDSIENQIALLRDYISSRPDLQLRIFSQITALPEQILTDQSGSV